MKDALLPPLPARQAVENFSDVGLWLTKWLWKVTDTPPEMSAVATLLPSLYNGRCLVYNSRTKTLTSPKLPTKK